MAPRTDKALEEAENKALQGQNESQDSQLVVSRWQSEYGIGLRSSSPIPEDSAQLAAGAKSVLLPVSFPQPAHHHKVYQRFVGSGTLKVGKPQLGRPGDSDPGPDVAFAQGKDHGARATVDASRASHLSAPSTTLTGGLKDADQSEQGDDDGLTNGFSHNDDADSEVCSSPLDLHDGGISSRGVDHSERPVESPNPLVRVDTIPGLPPSSFLAPRKMESSQQSPTQSNDGRSYEKYRHSSFAENNLPSTALIENFDRSSPSPSHGTSPGHRTLNEDDTGAVHFSIGLFENLRSHDTEVSAPETSAGLDSTAVDHPRWPLVDAPETPAPPKNPFAARNPATLLGGSQMFRQTQFSSAFRHVSPTSSRPSPNDFHNNSISPNPIISSPLKARGLRTSPLTANMTSPQVPFSASSRPVDEPETPHHEVINNDPLISQSPQYEPLKRRLGPELIDVYEPMGKSQERRETLELQTSPTESVEDLSDDENNRRRRARSKKAEAERHLSSINFNRPSASLPEDVEVPSTNKKGKSRSRTPAEEYVAQCRGKSDKDDETQETVADSQEQPMPDQIITEAAGFEESVRSPAVSNEVAAAAATELSSSTAFKLTREVTASSLPGPIIHLSAEESNGDAIPETSPADARPRAIGDILRQASSISSKPLSLPTMPSNVSEQDLTQSSSNMSHKSSASSLNRLARHRQDRVIDGAHVASDVHSPGSIVKDLDCSMHEDLSSQKQGRELSQSPEIRSSPPALRTRAKSRVQKASTAGKRTPVAPSSSAPAGVLSSTSMLSSLSTTPALSNKTTPLTQDSVTTRRSNGLKAVVAESSPAVAKVRRREVVDTLPKPKTSTVESLRTSTRLTRKQMQQDHSTDELAGSPPATPPVEYALRNSRVGRALTKGQPGSREQSSRGSMIFEGMSFAISFQSKRTGENLDQYNERMEHARAVEKKIQQGGGRVLAEGFDELFEASPINSADYSPTASQPDDELRLTSGAASGGFTALIADGHSRKVKYMQALALGLPCIASRWITTCFDRQEIVDWSPYLLCAGVSSFLGDAIRSRNLTPYDAKSARLCDVVDRRTMLLEGNKILLIMKKSGESKRMAYVFLARVLGACLSRVYSIDEAKVKLKAAEDAGQPFDWVYVDEKTAGKGELFLARTAEGKKRKRGGTGTYHGPPPKKVRTLSDELVVQSLIFGSIIEEGEMDD